LLSVRKINGQIKAAGESLLKFFRDPQISKVSCAIRGLFNEVNATKLRQNSEQKATIFCILSLKSSSVSPPGIDPM
jgi:hypothetical protein